MLEYEGKALRKYDWPPRRPEKTHNCRLRALLGGMCPNASEIVWFEESKWSQGATSAGYAGQRHRLCTFPRRAGLTASVAQ